jgi:hypothetical protein
LAVSFAGSTAIFDYGDIEVCGGIGVFVGRLERRIWGGIIGSGSAAMNAVLRYGSMF